MSTTDPNNQARELSDAWDRLLAGEAVPSGEPGRSEFDVIEHLTRTETDLVIPDSLQARIWNDVMRETARQLALGDQESKNPQATGLSWNQIAGGMSGFAWIVFAGLMGGFIAGIGSRIFMRLAGFLTVNQNRSLLTENEAAVGEITLGGTISLGMMGAGAGIFALLIYVAIRDRIPFEGWRRSSVFSVLLLLVFGYVIMDPSNPDYQTFGPNWLNVSTFSSLYLIMGFATVEIYEFGNRNHIRFAAARRHWFVQLPVLIGSAILSILALLLAPIALIIGASGLIVVAVAGLAWLVNHYVSPERFLAYRVPAFIRPWGMLVVPGIVGFVLTARGITEILVNR